VCRCRLTPVPAPVLPHRVAAHELEIGRRLVARQLVLLVLQAPLRELVMMLAGDPLGDSKILENAAGNPTWDSPMWDGSDLDTKG
jgi:hypothetical protein